MPRPRKPRFVQGHPIVKSFIPDSTPPWGHRYQYPLFEGLEAVKLNDYQGWTRRQQLK